MGGQPSDWISTVCSIVAAIVGIVTLVTVYLAAVQILSRRQVYQLGLSHQSLGPWRAKVAKPSILRMQTQISTPTISLPNLAKKQWQPKFTFPEGFASNPKADLESGDKDKFILAETGWVNFLQGLGVEPADEEDGIYEMQSQSELVNGIVPMRWKGSDLVGVASLLGFQTSEKQPDCHRSMALPTQWNGPIGWLQFRASSDGCIVEYRRRAKVDDVLPIEIHDYYNKLDLEPRPFCLQARLAHSMSGFWLSNNDYLLLAGTSEGVKQAKALRDQHMQKMLSIDEIANMVEKDNLGEEDIKQAMFGKVDQRPENLRADVSQLSQLPDSWLDSFNRVKKGSGGTRRQILIKSPGVLNIMLDHELAASRGFAATEVHEYVRIYGKQEDVPSGCGYRVGNLCVELDLLKLIKEAIHIFKPDDYLFTPDMIVMSDCLQIWTHIDDYSDDVSRSKIFSDMAIEKWESAVAQDPDVDSCEKQLLFAMKICNAFQSTKDNARRGHSTATIRDARILSIASVSMENIINAGHPPAIQPPCFKLRSRTKSSSSTWATSSTAVKNPSPPPALTKGATSTSATTGGDFEWALIYSKRLFEELAKRFEEIDVQSVLCKSITVKDGVVDYTPFEVEAGNLHSNGVLVDLMADGEYSGAQVFAAFLQVFLTYFWIESGIISNVAMYDFTIPQSVTMC